MCAAQVRARALYEKAGIALTPEEPDGIAVADFGLSDLENTGEIMTYINTERYCAKEMALFPRQTCPEHAHVPVDGSPPASRKPSDADTARYICMWMAGRRPARRGLYGVARDCAAARGTIHHPAGCTVLVSGRRTGRCSIRVQFGEPGRMRCVHRCPHKAYSGN